MQWPKTIKQNKTKQKTNQNKTKTKRQSMIDIILRGISKIEEHQPQMKSGGELECSEKVSCSFCISGARPSTFYLARCQALTSNSTSKKIKRTQNPPIQAHIHVNTSSDTRSFALISITTTSPS
jgi:hypothetical protein